MSVEMGWDAPTIDLLIKTLAVCMSDISEACWCAGWLNFMEEVLPGLCAEAVSTGEPVAWGQGHIDVSEARLMIALAESCGRWATYDDLPEGT